jgi:hypothetical protein
MPESARQYKSDPVTNYRLTKQQAIADSTRLRLLVNLSMARILIGYRSTTTGGPKANYRLRTACTTLRGVFKEAYPLGRLPEAAAAALLVGLISAIQRKDDDIDWFSQSASTAVRARQMETLWRAYLNLAHSLFRRGRSPHDPAAAALELLQDSLNGYAEPDRTPRFALVSVPMAHAVRYLLLAGDQRARRALGRFPALVGMFSSVDRGELKADRNGWSSHEWLRVDDCDYVIF